VAYPERVFNIGWIASRLVPSSGEISAAYAAGIYNLEGAMALAYWRGQMTSVLKYPERVFNIGWIASRLVPMAIMVPLRDENDDLSTHRRLREQSFQCDGVGRRVRD
jgi:hypothetical protein